MVINLASPSVVSTALAFVAVADAFTVESRNIRGAGLTYSSSPSPTWQLSGQHIAALFSGHRILGEPTVGPVNFVLITNVIIVCSFFLCIGLCFFFAKPYLLEKPLKNQTANEARTKFNKECPKEDRKTYESKEFKEKCKELFVSADADGNGLLDLKELKGPVQKFLMTDEVVEDEDVAKIIKCFDDDNNGIDPHEFCHMMKYFAMKKEQQKLKAAQEKSQKSRAGHCALSHIAAASTTNKKYPQEPPKAPPRPQAKAEISMGTNPSQTSTKTRSEGNSARRAT